jgi:glucokinase
LSIVLGVDLGATNVRVALSDVEGRILLKRTGRTTGGTGLDVVRQIVEMGRNALSSLGLTDRSLKAVGVGSIGPLDLKKGLIVNPPNLRVGIIPIVEGIEKHFNAPVKLLNDCVAAVLGEKRFGAGRNMENLVYVTISTGIGGGAIVDGHLLLGKDGNAHEVGHIVVDKEGLLECGCGKRGHWEAYCSGSGMVNYAKLLLKEWCVDFDKSSLRKLFQEDFSNAAPKMLFEAAREGDEVALRIIGEIGVLNAIGFANIVNAYDPELITVGGSVALFNSELILEPVKKNIPKYAINRLPEITITPLREDAVLYGALAAALE